MAEGIEATSYRAMQKLMLAYYKANGVRKQWRTNSGRVSRIQIPGWKYNSKEKIWEKEDG